MIKRLFIANRGEIAVRVVNACRKLGIEAVVAVSAADRETLAARLADRAVCVGAPRPRDSYLNMEALITAALGTGCDAVHPGYGFLAERPDFQRLCAANGIVFVGPTAETIEAMGDKLQARSIAKGLQVPAIPGSERVASTQQVLEFAEVNGYPLLLKASAGGGGRGMRLVRSSEGVTSAFENASAEARDAFGDPTLYVERYIERARHVEVQVMGDSHGNVVHLGERDCSVQRRYQKLIEEAPSPAVSPDLRARLTEAAVRVARRVQYLGAGTIEFLLDLDTMSFYFLEMNTRIQVEHPVTEMVTGIDLVAEQIRVAGGAPLSISQDAVTLTGHAIECRINAEAPEQQFKPSPGRITRWVPPTDSSEVRVDSHCYPGYQIPPFYDSLVAKLIVHGRDRAAAIASMSRALDSFVVDGVPTTIPFHQSVLADAAFRDGCITTRWVEEDFMKRRGL